jgi:hypothetical protein
VPRTEYEKPQQDVGVFLYFKKANYSGNKLKKAVFIEGIK